MSEDDDTLSATAVVGTLDPERSQKLVRNSDLWRIMADQAIVNLRILLLLEELRTGAPPSEMDVDGAWQEAIKLNDQIRALILKRGDDA